MCVCVFQNDAFLAPVDVSQVADYYEYVVHPMDLSLLERVNNIDVKMNGDIITNAIVVKT